MITTAATACNIRLIVETILASHTSKAYVEHNSQASRHAATPRFIFVLPLHTKYAMMSIDQCWLLSVLV